MNRYKWIFMLLAATAACLFLKYSDTVFRFLSHLKNITEPLLLGCAVAYILNIIINRIESLPVFKNEKFKKIRRPVSIICSIGFIFCIITLIIQIVIPQLLNAIGVLTKGIPSAISQLLIWLSASNRDWPQAEEFLTALNLNWSQLIQKAITYLTSGLSNIFTSTVFILNSIGSLTVNWIVAIIFSIYILAGKEQLTGQFKSAAKTYLKEKHYRKAAYVLSTAHDTFTKFIIGQCTEALIIGILCAAGLFIFRFPYASMIGTLTGATALIPVVGAYLGAFIGAFMIFTVSPIKALGFIFFIIILQQLEGNLIYPRVVGSSVGLPGIWVLAAVTVGGGLGGIFGMLMAVPLTATFYKLIRNDMRHRNKPQSCS